MFEDSLLKHAEILLGILLRIMPAIFNQVLYVIKAKLEGTVRYAGFLLAPAEGLGLRPRLFLPFVQKKAFMLFLLIYVIFGV